MVFILNKRKQTRQWIWGSWLLTRDLYVQTIQKPTCLKENDVFCAAKPNWMPFISAWNPCQIPADHVSSSAWCDQVPAPIGLGFKGLGLAWDWPPGDIGQRLVNWISWKLQTFWTDQMGPRFNYATTFSLDVQSCSRVWDLLSGILTVCHRPSLVATYTSSINDDNWPLALFHNLAW